MRYKVFFTSGATEIVVADSMKIEEGCVIFYRSKQEVGMFVLSHIVGFVNISKNVEK